MADPTDINISDDQKQIDYVETPRQPGEEYATFSAAKQRDKFFGGGGQEKLQGSGIVAGAVIRRDGTLDTSHAMEILETSAQAQQRHASEEKHRAERIKQRQEMFAIPENVPKDSSEYVWYGLRNAAQIARENVNRPITPDDQRWDYKQRDRADKKLQQFKLEQNILEELQYRVGEDAQRKREFLPAATSIEKLDILEERWQQMVDKDPYANYNLITRFGGRTVRVEDILSVLPDLQNRLAVAASASK